MQCRMKLPPSGTPGVSIDESRPIMCPRTICVRCPVYIYVHYAYRVINTLRCTYKVRLSYRIMNDFNYGSMIIQTSPLGHYNTLDKTRVLSKCNSLKRIPWKFGVCNSTPIVVMSDILILSRCRCHARTSQRRTPLDAKVVKVERQLLQAPETSLERPIYFTGIMKGRGFDGCRCDMRLGPNQGIERDYDVMTYCCDTSYDIIYRVFPMNEFTQQAINAMTSCLNESTMLNTYTTRTIPGCFYVYFPTCSIDIECLVYSIHCKCLQWARPHEPKGILIIDHTHNVVCRPDEKELLPDFPTEFADRPRIRPVYSELSAGMTPITYTATTPHKYRYTGYWSPRPPIPRCLLYTVYDPDTLNCCIIIFKCNTSAYNSLIYDDKMFIICNVARYVRLITSAIYYVTMAVQISPSGHIITLINMRDMFMYDNRLARITCEPSVCNNVYMYIILDNSILFRGHDYTRT